VRAIGRSPHARGYWDTLLVDKENFFQFNPLLPAVAVGAVETRHIVYPLRDMARLRRIRFVKNKALGIDLARRELRLHNNLCEPFDVLVLAVGSVTNYYDVPGAAEHTRPFKTLVDAMTLRARVVELFEMAEQAETESQRRRLLSFAVVGGGVTGVEVAAELMDMARDTLLPKYPSLQSSDLTITIIEGGERAVRTARPEHSTYVERFLARRGVRLQLNCRVARVEEKRLHFQDGGSLDAFTIVWTAGVHPPDLVRDLPLQHTRDGRLLVDDRLRVLTPEGRALDHVRAIGDSAAFTTASGDVSPTIAQSAVAMGAWLGRALVGEANGQATRPFALKTTGYIISLGQHSSVVHIFGLSLSGKLAWLMWAGAYLVKMVGLRKQIEVGIDHLTHLFFQHDTSQIMHRSQVLSDAELNLSLGAERAASQTDPASGAVVPPPVVEVR